MCVPSVLINQHWHKTWRSRSAEASTEGSGHDSPPTHTRPRVTGFPLNTNWSLGYIIIPAADCLNKAPTHRVWLSLQPLCIYTACCRHHPAPLLVTLCTWGRRFLNFRSRPTIKMFYVCFMSLSGQKSTRLKMKESAYLEEVRERSELIRRL